MGTAVAPLAPTVNIAAHIVNQPKIEPRFLVVAAIQDAWQSLEAVLIREVPAPAWHHPRAKRELHDTLTMAARPSLP